MNPGWFDGPAMALACRGCQIQVYAEDEGWCVCCRVAVPAQWTLTSWPRMLRQPCRASLLSQEVADINDQKK